MRYISTPDPGPPFEQKYFRSFIMVFGTIDTKREQSQFLKEVEEVKQWWKSPRFRKIKRYCVLTGFSLIGRPFTAESVVSKRGTLKVEYPSNTQAKKLFALLEKHAKVLSLWNSSFDELGRYTNAHLWSTGSYSWY